MLGVVLGDRRRADRPAQPVVEGADAGEEAERRGDARHDHVRVARLLGLEDRQAGDRAQRDDEPEAERAADEHPEERPREALVASTP